MGKGLGLGAGEVSVEHGRQGSGAVAILRAGTSMKFIEYYSMDTEARKQRRKSGKAEVQELKEEVATLKKYMVDTVTVDKLVADKVSETLQNMFPPGFMEGLAAWQAGGQ